MNTADLWPKLPNSLPYKNICFTTIQIHKISYKKALFNPTPLGIEYLVQWKKNV